MTMHLIYADGKKKKKPTRTVAFQCKLLRTDVIV